MKLNGFRFTIKSVFGSIDFGLHGILEVAPDSTKINFIIGGRIFYLKISSQEEFIRELPDIGVLNWNDKFYEKGYEDGYRRNLFFSYGDVVVETGGLNGYPKEFDAFMGLLHEKYQLPYLFIEGPRNGIPSKWHEKGTEVRDRSFMFW